MRDETDPNSSLGHAVFRVISHVVWLYPSLPVQTGAEGDPARPSSGSSSDQAGQVLRQASSSQDAADGSQNATQPADSRRHPGQGSSQSATSLHENETMAALSTSQATISSARLQLASFDRLSGEGSFLGRGLIWDRQPVRRPQHNARVDVGQPLTQEPDAGVPTALLGAEEE
jgi:hypothetical protein